MVAVHFKVIEPPELTSCTSRISAQLIRRHRQIFSERIFGDQHPESNSCLKEQTISTGMELFAFQKNDLTKWITRHSPDGGIYLGNRGVEKYYNKFSGMSRGPKITNRG